MRITYMLCFAVLVLFSCKDDAEVVLEPSEDIVGSWSLSSATGGLNPVVFTYEKGEVTLEFSESTVTIINQTEEEIGFPEGVYAYELTENDFGGLSLVVDDGFFNGGFELFTTQFTIDQRAWDGPLYTFVRD